MTIDEALRDNEFRRLYSRFFWHRQQFRDHSGASWSRASTIKADLALNNARSYAYDMITWLENRGVLKDELCEETTAQQVRDA